MKGCAQLDLTTPIVGTAPRESSYLVIELAKPWPSKLKKLDRVKSFIKALDRATKGYTDRPKVLATPSLDSGQDQAMLIRWDGTQALSQSVEFKPEAVAEALAHPATGQAEPIYLVCTHGSRDRCCGTLGYPVYRALKDNSVRRVLQVSHLGGHRYAPLVLAFPEWRFFGQVTPQRALSLDQSLGQGEAYLEGYRGNGRLGSEAQVAEAELWSRYGSQLKVVNELSRERPFLTLEAELNDGSKHAFEARIGSRKVEGYKSCEDLEKGKCKTVTLPVLQELSAATLPAASS